MSFWTPERVDALKVHFADGMTGGEIMREMGAPSRNVIVGKLHRLGLTRDDVPHEVRIARIQRGIASRGPRQPRTARPRRANPPGPVMFKAAPTFAPPATAGPPAASRPCGLLELTNESCRWPISEEGAPYLACGALEADVIHGVPYCRTHSRIAYRRPGEREEAA